MGMAGLERGKRDGGRRIRNEVAPGVVHDSDAAEIRVGRGYQGGCQLLIVGGGGRGGERRALAGRCEGGNNEISTDAIACSMPSV